MDQQGGEYPSRSFALGLDDGADDVSLGVRADICVVGNQEDGFQQVFQPLFLLG